MRLPIALGLLASLWLVPPLLPIAQWPLKHFHREWLAAALALAACAMWLPLRGQPLVLPRSGLYLLAFALYVLAQPLFVDAPYAQPAVAYALYLGWAALLLIAAAGVRERAGSQSMVRAICWAAFAGALLTAAAGCLQAYGVPAWVEHLILQDRRMTVFGNLQHASYFADQLLMGIVAGAWLFAGRWLRAWALLAGFALIGLALALSGSRAVVLVLVLLPLSGALLWMRQRDESRSDPAPRRLTLASGAALIAFLAWEWGTRTLPMLAPAAGHRSTLARVPHDGAGMNQRWPLWDKALEMFADSPVFGAGPDAFTWHYFRLLESQPALAYTVHSHNLVTEILACFGLIGTGLLAAALGGFAWRQRARLPKAAWWPVNAMLAIVLLRALLDLNLWFAHLLAPFVVLMGVAEQGGVRAPGRFAPHAYAMAVVIGAVVLLVTMRDFRAMAVAGAAARPTGLAAALGSARDNPFFTALVDSIRADAMQVDLGGSRAQLVLNSRSMNWRPTPRMVWRQTALLAVNGYPAEACRLLDKALRIHPRHADRARGWYVRNTATPAIATLLGQMDGLQAGGSVEASCNAAAVAGAVRQSPASSARR
ncbi:MAG: O-antigen ligase family protein [Burkholderiales bacterium]|nr:O-antigen ligase family protein [Burkholderiales bacterium]